MKTIVLFLLLIFGLRSPAQVLYARYLPYKQDSNSIQNCRDEIYKRLVELKDPMVDVLHEKVNDVPIFYVDSFYMDIFGLITYYGLYLPDKNYIIISNATDFDRDATIIHELNHYVDWLKGDSIDSINVKTWSNIHKLNSNFDPCDFENVNKIMDNLIKMFGYGLNVNRLANDVYNNSDYYSLNVELYVRLIEMKRQMMIEKIVESYSCTVDVNDVKLFRNRIKNKINFNNHPSYFPMIAMFNDVELVRLINSINEF